MEQVVALCNAADGFYEWNCPHCGVKSYGDRKYWPVAQRNIVHRCAYCHVEYIVRRESWDETMDRLYPDFKSVREIMKRVMRIDDGNPRTDV